MPRIIEFDDAGEIDPSEYQQTERIRKKRTHRNRRANDTPRNGRRPDRSRRADGQESFKCGHCKAFIGPTVSGGRHRNHCPLCLYSRHVDDRHPGDRASDCRSLMAPVATFHRPKGEQVIVHRCLGCGIERHNRVAADDNMIACLRLPPVAPRLGGKPEAEDDAAIA
ncbi:MAG TPA: RNHCP domain-containing protein [Thermomicrobiales bacterium]|nr:RNHCP domain-containing protein [Thermomicrobiales bacterium]